MIEPPFFGKILPEPRINIEDELEMRIIGVHNSRNLNIDETQEDRKKRIEAANYSLEDFCTGLLLGLKMGSK